MNVRRPSRRAAGFSMVEFLVAAFILSIGLLGLIALQVGAVAQATHGRGRTTAAYVANAILQQAQVEGQYSYLAKLSSATPPTAFTRVFTATAGAAIASTTYGGFNVDGVQVTDGSGNALTNIATLVPDANKRSPIYTASWLRRAYEDNGPAGSTQSQEFVVNVAWQENGQNKYLSLSRTIRY